MIFVDESENTLSICIIIIINLLFQFSSRFVDTLKMSSNLDDYSFPYNCGNGLKVALISKMGSYMFIELENDYNDLHV